jgi:hypothetical protein
VPHKTITYGVMEIVPNERFHVGQEENAKKLKICLKLGVKIPTCQANTTFKITPIIK